MLTSKTQLFAAVLSVMAATPAAAQLRLPALPALPITSTLQTLPATLDRVTTARQLKIDDLIRHHRRTIDQDRNGNPIVRSEVLALSPSAEVISAAQASGFILDRSRPMGIGEMRLVIFKCPPNLSARAGIDRFHELDPSGTYDYNHLYTNSGIYDSSAAAAKELAVSPALGVRAHIRVGLLDTGIDVTHTDFRDSQIHSFGCGAKSYPAEHGTAVASLLVNHASAELYAADVYCASPSGGAVDAIIAALAWMAEEKVAVINVSLVGPNNALLERAVASLIARGHLIVAAVGNDGPTAPPLYPAAYPQVIGVTGVDANHHVLFEALRGPQVFFAALGADITAANMAQAHSRVRGTSFAAPCVAALLAAALRAPDTTTSQAAVEDLARDAIDLGPPGRDLTYGYGLVGNAAR